MSGFVWAIKCEEHSDSSTSWQVFNSLTKITQNYLKLLKKWQREIYAEVCTKMKNITALVSICWWPQDIPI